MRWKGLIFIVVLATLIGVASVFFMDGWIESGLEKAGEAVVGAKVDIDGLHVNILTLTFKLDRLQVTDPKSTMQNVLETDRIAFRMNMSALLRRKSVIREMTMANVRTGTARAYDGALPKKPKKARKKTEPSQMDKMKGKLATQVHSLPVMRFDPKAISQNLNLDSLIVMADLQLPAKLDSSKEDIVSTAADWEKFYQTFRPEEDLEKIKADFNAIDPDKLKTVPELLSALQKVQSAHKTLKALQDTIKTRHKQITTDFNRIHGYAKAVDDWYKRDYRSVLSKAKLPDLNVKNIALMLFGKDVVSRFNQYLGYVQTVRKYMPKKSDAPQKEKPQRLKGQDIHFTSRYAWPEFLIENIHLSGQTGTSDSIRGLVLTGDATGINNQPWIYGKPTVIQLTGKKDDGRSLQVDGSLDHTTDLFQDRLNLALKNVSLNNVSVDQSDYLPSKIKKGKADIRLRSEFIGNQVDADINIVCRGLDFDFEPTSDQFMKIVQQVIRELDVITLRMDVKGTGDDLTFGLNSNLDTQVSRELKRMGSEALARAERQINGRLNQIKKDKLAEVDKVYKEKRKAIEGKIEEYEEEVEAQRVAIEAKIDKIRKDAETKKRQEENKLEDKAKKALDKLF